MLRRKNILGNSHENAEELERTSEMKEKEAALCLEFLLQNDANPSIQDKEGYNTVHYAAAYGHRQCLELLLEKKQQYVWGIGFFSYEKSFAFSCKYEMCKLFDHHLKE